MGTTPPNRDNRTDNQSPFPRQRERAPSVRLQGSGRDLLLCDGLGDGIGGKGTPTTSDHREP
jgi:hypothetical protein